jgi:PIN domain nuclease of toxin-antitoxin system
VKLLLDSHVLLWSIDRPQLLSARVREAILNEENDLFVSVVSLWEIAIKSGAGKLRLPSAPNFMETHLRELGIRSYLPITLTHIRGFGKLPPIHKDPFDRMLLSQAITERLTLVSKDEQFHRYPVKMLW